MNNKEPSWLIRVMTFVGSTFMAAIFFSSAIAKASASSEFHKFITSLNVHWLPEGDYLVYTVICSEIILGGLILIRRTRWWASIAAVGMLSMFTVVLVYSLFLGSTEDCGCFGELSSGTPIEFDIIRNVFLIIISLLVNSGSRRNSLV